KRLVTRRCFLDNAKTIGWLTNRATIYDLATQSVPTSRAAASPREILGTAATALNLFPSWAILAMILIATTAVCCTVIARSQAEFSASVSQHQHMASEIDSLRQANQSLQVEITKLTNDSHTIELAARQRLGMVRANDIIVPMESISSSTSLGTLSFVR